MPVEKLYDDIDEQKWRRIKQSAHSKAGISIAGNTGQGKSWGVTLQWAFAPASKKLAIAILDSEWASLEQSLEFVDAIISTA